MIQQNIEKRDWNEFRKTGLFMFVNIVLHAFGWALVIEVNKSKELGDVERVIGVYPARVKFRGFSESDQTEMHERIANYLASNSPDFPEEIR